MKKNLCFLSQKKPQEHLLILHNCVRNHRTCCSFFYQKLCRVQNFLYLFKKTHWLYAPWFYDKLAYEIVILSGTTFNFCNANPQFVPLAKVVTVNLNVVKDKSNVFDVIAKKTIVSTAWKVVCTDFHFFC